MTNRPVRFVSPDMIVTGKAFVLNFKLSVQNRTKNTVANNQASVLSAHA